MQLPQTHAFEIMMCLSMLKLFYESFGNTLRAGERLCRQQTTGFVSESHSAKGQYPRSVFLTVFKLCHLSLHKEWESFVGKVFGM